MNKIEAMTIYMRVAELASFTATAESLGLPKASVSTAVQQLENLLGTRLLHRTTRRVQITQDGQVFYERCKDLLADIDELQNLFQGQQMQLQGRLRVDMPIAVARDIVMPQLPLFLARHPQLEVELSSTDRRVDLVREGFDCVLRVAALTDSSLIAKPLGHYRMINYASPAYLATYGTPETLDDLAHHQLIHYLPTFGGHSAGFEYCDTSDNHTVRYLPMSGNLTVNNSDSYLSACLAGLGIIQSPEASLKTYIKNGQLIEVLPQYRAAPMPVSLIYANRRHLPMRVQVFMDWIAEVIKPRLMA